MPPKSNVPIRIGGSRQRSGCKTCKQRHVKCDEGRPICVKCQRAKRECVYAASEPPSRRSTPPDRADSVLVVARASQYHNQLAWPGLNSSIHPSGSFDSLETSAIQHFATLLGKELRGSFSNGVWCDILPRVAHHEPSIWHGIVAVSTLDTGLRLKADSQPNRAAIVHYSKAIQELNKRLSEINDASCKDVILLSCILFAVFECLQSHYKSALRHVRGGIKLLVEWGGEGQLSNQVTLGSYLDRTALQSIFLTLDSQAIQMGAVDFQDSSPGTVLDDPLQVPLTFSNTEDAQLYLNKIFHRLSHWSNSRDSRVPDDNKPEELASFHEQQCIRVHLNKWDSAFEPLLQNIPYDPPTLLLLSHRKVIEVHFGKEVDGPSELEFDKYLPLFQEAVALIEQYTQLTATDATGSPGSNTPGSPYSSRPRAKLTIAMDVVLSLFLISTRCRDSRTRRRALQLLQTRDCKEGIWDSQILVRMVAKVIELEEAAALEDGFIPDNARMHNLDVRLGEERTAEVSHKALTQDADGYHRTETFAEDIVW